TSPRPALTYSLSLHDALPISLRSAARDRDFALFWSNIQVLGPSIYARPPVPVVTPKFKDRRPLYRTSSEFLERVCTVSFDMADRSEEHTSELQSREKLVCRLL